MKAEIEQINELIKRDYRVPRFAKLSIDSNQSLFTEHISLKDVLLPVMKDYHATMKREEYLIEVVKYFTTPGCLFPYLDNIKKQEFMNRLHEAIPTVNWHTWFYDKLSQDQGGKA